MATFELVIKSPSSATEEPLRLTVPVAGTVADIKRVLTTAHPEHPEVHEQRLIFAGRLLENGSKTSEVLRQRDLSEPQTFHLMLPIKERPEPPSLSRAATTPATATTGSRTRSITGASSAASNAAASAPSCSLAEHVQASAALVQHILLSHTPRLLATPSQTHPSPPPAWAMWP